MVTYLSKFGIEAFVGPKKKYSTDANLAGLSHEAEDLEPMQTCEQRLFTPPAVNRRRTSSRCRRR